jgi:hypothetical protein
LTPEGAVAFTLCGEELIADASGALYWPREECLIVADLHFEKGSAFARRGVFLPPYDTRATLGALEAALDRNRPKRVIALGDSFHDLGGPERLAAEERATLLGLMKGRDWIWVLGNHDPAPPGYGGTAIAELALAGIVLRHEPLPGRQAGEIAGHLHPCATVRTIAGRVRRRCFATDAQRLILPAFGAYAGGLSVFDPAFAHILARPFEVIVLGRARAYLVGERRLARDAA